MTKLFFAVMMLFAGMWASSLAQDAQDVQGELNESQVITGGIRKTEISDVILESRVIRLRPIAAVENISSRLFPSSDRLKRGNAAPILLRMNWEAKTTMPQIDALRGMDLWDKSLEELDVKLVYVHDLLRLDELRRAAFRQQAGWEYPFDEIAPLDILLPDVQGFREYGNAIAISARIDIKLGKLQSAEDKICIGLGLVKHIGETPFIVCQLVQMTNCRMNMEVIEELIQHPEAPNYYWDLSQIEGLIPRVRETVQMECAMIEKSFPEYAKLIERHDEIGWQQFAQKAYRLIRTNWVDELPAIDSPQADQYLKDWNALARRRLPTYAPSLEGSMAKMSDAEIGMRYWWLRTQEWMHRLEGNALLEIDQAIPRTAEVYAEAMKECQDEPMVRGVLPALHNYLEVAARLEQNLAMLRVTESIRDWSAKHDGQLPATLNDLDLPPPVDCVTDQPFRYVLSEDEKTASLRTNPVQADPKNKPRSIRYQFVRE